MSKILLTIAIVPDATGYALDVFILLARVVTKKLNSAFLAK